MWDSIAEIVDVKGGVGGVVFGVLVGVFASSRAGLPFFILCFETFEARMTPSTQWASGQFTLLSVLHQVSL